MAGFGAAASSAQAFNQKMNRVGTQLTRMVTVPIAAAAVGAVAMAVDFDKSLTHIQALVGASAKDMDMFRKSVLQLAGETGRAPKELAEALYFVTSSGFKGAAALKVLTASAKASAAGLGETKVIADAVTSAISAYGEQNLSAAKATDIMLAAVREGKNEPEELAGSIGRVIPVAQAMGVSFGEVAGTIAALSLNGTDANEAVTQITAGLSQAIKPTVQGAKALATLNLTYADLRKEIAQKGLIDTFNDLKKAFGGNVEEIAKVFGNIRALRGVLTLTGVSAEKYEGIIKRVGEAQGDTNKAFDIASKSSAFKLEQAWAKIKVAAINAGEKLIPAALKIAGAVEKAADAFSRLGSSGQDAVLALLGIAAFVGPLAKIAGSAAAIKTALTGAKIAAGASGGMAAAGAAGGTAAAAGLVALIPAAAISAAIATAIVVGLDAGIKQARANREAHKGFWEDFWSTNKAIALSGSKFMDKLMGAEAADRTMATWKRVTDQLAKDFTATWGQAQQRIFYMQQDMEKALELPDVKKAIVLDTRQSRAQLLALARTIQTSLKIPLKEAQQIVQRIFPDDWAENVGTSVNDAGKKIERVTANIEKMRDELAKNLAFGKLDNGPLIRKIKAAEAQLAQLRAEFAKSLVTGPLDTRGWVGPLSSAAQDLKNFRALASAGLYVPPVIIDIIKRNAGVGTDANGGLYTKPRLTVVGDAGPEVVIPLTRPARAAQLMQQAGLTDAMAANGALGSSLQVNVVMPGGSTIIGTAQQVSTMLAPLIAREVDAATARKERRR